MWRRIIIPYFPLLGLYGALVVVVGCAQAALILHQGLAEDGGASEFLFQALAGPVDVLFPVLAIVVSLLFLPAEIETGFIRHYLALPCTRTRVLATVGGAYSFLWTAFFLLYEAAVSCVYAAGHFVGLDWRSILGWILMAPFTAACYLILERATLLFFFLTRHRLAAFALSVVFFFLIEVIAGVTSAYRMFPTTQMALFAEWVVDWTTGASMDYAALGLQILAVIVWNAVLWTLDLRLFRRLTLIYVA